MIYHILNGDALVERFQLTGLSGETVIMRECLIEGNLEGKTLTDFFKTRAKFISRNYSGDYDAVVGEMNKILNAHNPSEFNLWFGYDLFCQVNLWFLLSVIKNLPINKNVFIVYPSHLAKDHIWEDFGSATKDDLVACYSHRIRLLDDDLMLAEKLWNSYKECDLKELQWLSQNKCGSFPYLQEVIIAHIQRFDVVSRPEKVIKEIASELSPDFITVFKEFGRREGIYGFGDSQLRNIYDKIIPSIS